MIEKGSSIGGMKTPLVLSSVKPPAIKDPSLLADSFRRQEQGELGLIPAPKIVGDARGDRKLPRKLSENEKPTWKQWFPNLDVDNTVVSGEADYKYNCIAWSVGETKQWFWPPSMYPGMTENAAFDKFYGSYGLEPAPAGDKGTVARWGNAAGLTHGCVRGEGHGPNWESKCGSALKIEHRLEELHGETYGKPEKFYRPAGGEKKVKPYPTLKLPAVTLKRVANAVSLVPDMVRKNFEKEYGQWQQFKKSPQLQMSSNPADYCSTGSFDKIVNMGAPVVPLLMEKMAGGDFFCLQAVKQIGEKQRAGTKIASFLPRGKAVEASEQNKAVQAVINFTENL